MRKIGIIVPYRDRKQHLDCFLPSIESALEAQDINNYQIYIVEQADDRPFNRGALLNLGALKAIAEGCTELCFHDVDLIPKDVDYGIVLGEWPVELVKEVKGGEAVAYNYFGGAAMVLTRLFLDVNGYSNSYEGWGYEDDDFLLRLYQAGYTECSAGFQTPYTSGKGLEFPETTITIPCSEPAKSDKVIFVADFVPRFPSKEVGTRDMKVLSLETGKGKEAGISYDRYEGYRFDIWDSGYKYHYLTTGKRPVYHSRIVVELDLETKEFSMFHNGNYCGTEYLDVKRSFIFSPKELKVGGPDFEGILLEAGMVYSSRNLTREEGEKLSLIQVDLKEMLGEDTQVFWARPDGNVDVPYQEYITVPVPCKPARGLFEHLDHERANLGSDGLSESARQNQERFYKVSRGEIRGKDGLSNIGCLYSTEVSNYDEKVTWIKATRV